MAQNQEALDPTGAAGGAAQQPSAMPKPWWYWLPPAGGAVILAVVHAFNNQAVLVDGITVGLLVFACLPLVASLLESAELPGGWKVQFSRIQEHQAALERRQQAQAEQIDALKFLVARFLTRHEILHLRRLASPGPCYFRTTQLFQDQLRRLRDLELVDQSLDLRGIRDLPQEGEDLKQFITISEEGRKYLDMRTRLGLPS